MVLARIRVMELVLHMCAATTDIVLVGTPRHASVATTMDIVTVGMPNTAPVLGAMGIVAVVKRNNAAAPTMATAAIFLVP